MRQKQCHGQQARQRRPEQLEFHQHQQLKGETAGLAQAAAEGDQPLSHGKASQQYRPTAALAIPFQLSEDGGECRRHGLR